MNMGDIAANLYDGGWRASDREQMIGYYTLTEDEADAICELLEEYENADREDTLIVRENLAGIKEEASQYAKEGKRSV